MLDIAEEAYAASKLEPKQYAVRETAALIGIYWDQNAPSARDCFSFLLDGRTLLSGPESKFISLIGIRIATVIPFSEKYRHRAGEGAGMVRQHCQGA